MNGGKWFDRALVGDTGDGRRANWMWLGSSLRSAAACRPALLVTGLATLAAVLAAAPAILLIVPALFVALFVASFVTGRTRREAVAAARAAAIPLPDAAEFQDPRAKALATRLDRARQAIRGIVRSGPHGAGFDLAGPLSSVAQLERDAVVLLARFEYAARFLADNAIGEARAGLLRLEQCATEDPASREAVSFVARRCEARLRALTSLTLEAERVYAAADEIVDTLERLPIEVLELQLRRLEACDDRIATAGPRTSNLQEDVEALNHALVEEPPIARASSGSA